MILETEISREITDNSEQKELEKPLSREELLRLNASLLKKIHARLAAERFKPREADSQFFGALRAYSGLMSATTALMRDSDLDELNKRLTALEEVRR